MGRSAPPSAHAAPACVHARAPLRVPHPTCACCSRLNMHATRDRHPPPPSPAPLCSAEFCCNGTVVDDPEQGQVRLGRRCGRMHAGVPVPGWGTHGRMSCVWSHQHKADQLCMWLQGVTEVRLLHSLHLPAPAAQAPHALLLPTGDPAPGGPAEERAGLLDEGERVIGGCVLPPASSPFASAAAAAAVDTSRCGAQASSPAPLHCHCLPRHQPRHQPPLLHARQQSAPPFPARAGEACEEGPNQDPRVLRGRKRRKEDSRVWLCTPACCCAYRSRQTRGIGAGHQAIASCLQWASPPAWSSWCLQHTIHGYVQPGVRVPIPDRERVGGADRLAVPCAYTCCAWPAMISLAVAISRCQACKVSASLMPFAGSSLLPGWEVGLQPWQQPSRNQQQQQ